ncbi:GIN domain-containing protein [Cellulomonas soli]
MASRRRTPARAVGPLLVAALLGAVVLSGCDVPIGPQTAQRREVGSVTSVRLTTPGRLTIVRGEHPGLTVTAADNALPYLTSEVHDGVLVLGVQDAHEGAAAGAIAYDLVVDELEAVAVEGSGDVTATGATGDRLDVQVDGSGEVVVRDVDVDRVTVAIKGSGLVDVAGRAAAQVVSVDGSGGYGAADLTAQDAVVSVEGSGDVDVDVTGTLGVHIAGCGSVTHTGGAAVTAHVDGRGQVRQG